MCTHVEVHVFMISVPLIMNMHCAYVCFFFVLCRITARKNIVVAINICLHLSASWFAWVYTTVAVIVLVQFSFYLMYLSYV